MSKNPVPSLDTTGWQTGIAQRADRLFAYWLVSEVSQSNNFGDIQSLPFLLQTHGNDPDGLASAVKTSLNSLFVDYFQQVNINITVESINDDTSLQNLKIDVRVRDDGLEYNLARLIETSNKSVKSVKDLTKI